MRPDDEIETHDEPRGWWRRPCGGRAVLVVAAPLIVSTASWSVMHFCDRMFLLWYSPNAMAAALPSGVFHFFLLCFPLGLATYVNTFVAQYFGAGRDERIGRAVAQGMWVGLVCIPVYLSLIPLAGPFFRWVAHDPAIVGYETTYFQVLTCEAGGVVFAAALSSFFIGRGETTVVMLVNAVAALLNIVLDYLFIFGVAGFPEMGIAGAAWATVIGQWCKPLIYLALIFRPRYSARFGIRHLRTFDGALMWRLLRFGGPSALQMTVTVGAFAVFILIVGQLGPDAMAATTLAFNVETLAWVPMLGLGMAVSTLVGQQLGADRPDLAARATWTAFVVSLVYMSAMAVVYLSIPHLLLLGHRAGADPAEFAALQATTIVLLRFVAAYCIFDAMNLIFCSAIKGAGDTLFVLMTTIITSPLPVAAGWAGIHWGGLGLYWCWTVITLWVWCLGVTYILRFLHGKWREMRVIEPEMEENGAGPGPGDARGVYGPDEVSVTSGEW